MAGGAVLLAALLTTSPAPEWRVRVDGTEFALERTGEIVRGPDLVGAKLSIEGLDGQLAIESIERDAKAIGGAVTLYGLAAIDAAGTRRELCDADADGLRRGFPIADGRGGFTLACTSGANGKCVRWGYRPWEEQARGVPMQALHAACIRMARADYGGDGVPHTRAGTVIVFWDRFGVRPRPDADRLPFEAGWDAEGAICVARPRVPALASLSVLRHRYPRLVRRETCTERSAFEAGALIVNRLVSVAR